MKLQQWKRDVQASQVPLGSTAVSPAIALEEELADELADLRVAKAALLAGMHGKAEARVRMSLTRGENIILSVIHNIFSYAYLQTTLSYLQGGRASKSPV